MLFSLLLLLLLLVLFSLLLFSLLLSLFSCSSNSCCLVVVQVDIAPVPPGPVVPAAVVVVVIPGAEPEVVEFVLDAGGCVRVGRRSAAAVGVFYLGSSSATGQRSNVAGN